MYTNLYFNKEMHQFDFEWLLELLSPEVDGKPRDK